MAQNTLLQRLLEAGMQFTQLTQQRAEALVKEFVRAGELQAEQAQSAVAELVERSRKNTEKLVDTIQGEVRKQMATFEEVSREAWARMDQQIPDLRGQEQGARPPVTQPAGEVTAPATKAKKATAKKKSAPKKKSAAKKTASTS